MTKKRFLLALALMLTAVGGAWAQGNTTPVNWNAATKTGSLTVPAGNVTLSVDYYGQYRLDSIPQGWEVKVNGTLMGSDTLKTYTDGGNPQMRYIAAINETDSVELLPPAELRGTIKAVRLTESVAAPQLQSLQVGAGTIYYLPGETWQDAINNHPTENAGWNINMGYVWYSGIVLIGGNGSLAPTSPSAEINSNGTYSLSEG